MTSPRLRLRPLSLVLLEVLEGLANVLEAEAPDEADPAGVDDEL
jgi:hypothetical protein